MQCPLTEGSGFHFSSVLDGGDKGELALTPTQMTTNLQTHGAADMEDKGYTMHSFRMGRAAGHNMNGTAFEVLMEHVERNSSTVSRRYIELTASAAAMFSRKWRSSTQMPYHCPSSLGIHIRRSHRPIEAGPKRGRGRSLSRNTRER